MSEYSERVAHNLRGIDYVSTGANSRCLQCLDTAGLSANEAESRLERDGMFSEPGFSWSPCESCNSSLGGDREPAHGFALIQGKETLVHMDICIDCVFFLEYGHEPEPEDADND